MTDPKKKKKITKEEFASKIRTKYPSAYKDKTDDEVYTSITKKFPKYADLVQESTPDTVGTTQEEPKNPDTTKGGIAGENMESQSSSASTDSLSDSKKQDDYLQAQKDWKEQREKYDGKVTSTYSRDLDALPDGGKVLRDRAVERLEGLYRSTGMKDYTITPNQIESEAHRLSVMDEKAREEESKFEDMDFWSESWDKIKSGAASAVGSIAQVPSAINQAMVGLFAPQEDLDKLNKLDSDTKEVLINKAMGKFNPVMGYISELGSDIHDDLKETSNKIQEGLTQFDTAISEDIGNGDYVKAGTRVASEAIGSIPSIVQSMLPYVGISSIVAGSSAEKLDELQEEGKDLNTTSVLNSGINGAAEGLLEIVTKKMGGKLLKSLKGAGTAGKDGILNGVKEILKNSFDEGVSEGATVLIQDLSDAYVQGDGANWDNTFKKVADAILIGAASGGALGSIKTSSDQIHKVKDDFAISQVIKRESNPYNSISEAFKETSEVNIDQLDLTSNPRSSERLSKELSKLVESGDITQEESDSTLNNYTSLVEVYNKTEGVELSPKKRIEAINLIRSKEKISESIKNTDPSLAKNKKEEVAAIEEKLSNLASPQTAEKTVDIKVTPDSKSDSPVEVKEDTFKEPEDSKELFVKNSPKKTLSNFKNALKEARVKGTINITQERAINGKLAKLDLNNEGKIGKFLEYYNTQMGRVTKRQTSKEAKSVSRKVRKNSRTKSKSVPQSLKNLAREAGRLNPNKFSEADQGRYTTLVGKINDSFRPSDNAKYSMVDSESAVKELNELKGIQEKYIESEMVEKYGEDYKEVLFSEKSLEESKEIFNSFSKERKRKLKDKVVNIATKSSNELNKFDTKDSSDSEKSIVKRLKNLPLQDLDAFTIKRYTKIVDNITTNNDFSSSEDLLSKIEGSLGSKRFQKVLEKSGFLGIDSKLNDLKTMALLHKGAFGDTKVSVEFEVESGLIDVNKGEAITKVQEKKLADDYADVIKKALKVDPKVLESNNTIFRGVVANLIQGDTKEDFEINKSRIEQDIERKSKNTDSSGKKEYQFVKEAYDRVSNLNSQEEIIEYMKSYESGNWSLMEHWMNWFESTKDELQENTERVHGTRMGDLVHNYLPIKLKSTITLDADSTSSKYTDGGLNEPSAVGSTIQRTKTKRLPDNKKLDLNFDSVMFDRSYRVLNDINTSKPMKKVYHFLEDLGKSGAMDPKTIEVYKRKVQDIQEVNARTSSTRSWDIEKPLNALEKSVRKVATKIALGGVTQYIKQYVPIISNTSVRMGASNTDILFTEMFKNHSDAEIYNKFSIGARGDKQGGINRRGDNPNDRKVNRIVSRSISSKLGSIGEKLDNAIFYSLTKGDVNAARTTWTSYYKKSLRDQGVDLSSVDMDTEHDLLESDPKRKKAAAYAELMIEETQLTASEGRGSKLFSTSGNAALNILKSLFLPYQSFTLNSKVRMMVDLSNIKKSIKTGNKEARDNAISSLGGTLAEQVTFQGMKYFVLANLLALGKEGVAGLFGIQHNESEEEKEKKEDFNFKKFKTAILTDINPFAIGSVGEHLSVELLNLLAYADDKFIEDSLQDDEDLFSWSKRLQKESGGLPFYKYGDTPGFTLGEVDAGLYAAPLDMLGEAMDSYELSFDMNPRLRNSYGGYTSYNLSDKERNVMKTSFIMELMSMTLGMEADTYRQVKGLQRKILKESKVKKRK